MGFTRALQIDIGARSPSHLLAGRETSEAAMLLTTLRPSFISDSLLSSHFSLSKTMPTATKIK